MESTQERSAIPSLGFYPHPPIGTGTTLIAMEFDGGVIVGTDSRTSAPGSFIPSRATNKITPLSDHLVVCRCGNAADTQAITDALKMHIDVLSVTEQEPVSVHRAAQLARRYIYGSRHTISAAVLVAGHDSDQGGQVFIVTSDGSVLKETTSHLGSGSTHVQGYLDESWRRGLTRDECKVIVARAVSLAIFRDGNSGGVIRLATIDSSGTTTELLRPDRPGYPVVRRNH